MSFKRKDLLAKHLESYTEKLNNLLNKLNIEDLDSAMTTIIDTMTNGKTLWFCGNGGSAATASHMQVDFGYFVRYFSAFSVDIFYL